MSACTRRWTGNAGGRCSGAEPIKRSSGGASRAVAGRVSGAAFKQLAPVGLQPGHQRLCGLRAQAARNGRIGCRHQGRHTHDISVALAPCSWQGAPRRSLYPLREASQVPEFLTSVDLGVSLFWAARTGRQSRRQTLPWRQDRAGGSRRPSTDCSSGTWWAGWRSLAWGRSEGGEGGIQPFIVTVKLTGRSEPVQLWPQQEQHKCLTIKRLPDNVVNGLNCDVRNSESGTGPSES